MKKVDLIFILIFYYLFKDTRDTILEEEEEEGHLTLRGKKRSNLMFVTPQVHNNPESELFFSGKFFFFTNITLYNLGQLCEVAIKGRESNTFKIFVNSEEPKERREDTEAIDIVEVLEEYC